MKKTITILIAAALAFALCGCSFPFLPSNESSSESLPPDAPAHERLLAEVSEWAKTAVELSDMGLTFQSDYVFGRAQAEVSSLRLCVDTVLWLKGEGENLSAVIGNAPYRTWDDITGAGPGSDAPVYFEGLIAKFRGETEQAEDLQKKAKANPASRERDFYYLRNLSVSDLYKVKEAAAKVEDEIHEQYTPRSVLTAERTGAEYSPDYHLALAERSEDDPAKAAQCALNALLVNPYNALLYSAAAAYALNAKDAEGAYEILNEALVVFPDDVSVNYTCGLYCVANEDNDSAKTYLEAAKTHADPEKDKDLLAAIDKLISEIGG